MGGEIILGAVISLATTVTIIFVQAITNFILEKQKNKRELIGKIYDKKISGYDQIMFNLSNLDNRLEYFNDITRDNFDIKSADLSNYTNALLENYEKYEIYFELVLMNKLNNIIYYLKILIKLLRIYENKSSLKKLDYLSTRIVNSEYKINNSTFPADISKQLLYICGLRVHPIGHFTFYAGCDIC